MKSTGSRVLNFIKSHILRIALALFLIAVLFVAPLLTSAQYKWKLNDYTVLQASEFYFDSNYLHDSSKTSYYHTTGWNGDTTSQPLKNIEIRNFNNALLANKTGENAEYVLEWNIKTFIVTGESGGNYTYREAGANEGYKISTVTRRGDGASRTNGISKFTGTLTGDGTPQKDTYDFTFQLIGDKPAWNSYVRVTMTAVNVKFLRDSEGNVLTDANGNAQYEETDSFKREISATFEYVLTSTSGFITKFDPVDSVGYKDFELNIGTGSSPSAQGDLQTVTVWWDNTKVSINPFNITFQTMLQKETDTVKYYYAQYSASLPNISSLTITELGSNATRTLDFYKDVTITMNYYGTDHNLSKTDSWFFKDNNPPTGYTAFDSIAYLTDKNVRPENKSPQTILGYYVIDN